MNWEAKKFLTVEEALSYSRKVATWIGKEIEGVDEVDVVWSATKIGAEELPGDDENKCWSPSIHIAYEPDMDLQVEVEGMWQVVTWGRVGEEPETYNSPVLPACLLNAYRQVCTEAERKIGRVASLWQGRQEQ